MGVPGGATMTHRTIPDLYRHDLATPRAGHLSHWTPDGHRTISSEEFLGRTAALADSLANLGVGRGDRVLLLSDNRPEWHVVDLAVLALGAVLVPIYSTLTVPQVAYQLEDSGAKVAVGEGEAYVGTLVAARSGAPALEHLIRMEGEAHAGALSLADLVAPAGADSVDRLWGRAEAVGEDDLATIVYTSGTTGEPKGVMLSHRNIVTNVREAIQLNAGMSPGDVGLEFLPLCHMIERIAGYCCMAQRLDRAYCSVHDVAQLIGVVRPAFFAAVPRVLEKVHDAVQARAAAASPLRRALFRWAVETGRETARRRIRDGRVPLGLRVRHGIADRLVLGKVRSAFGGRLRGVFSGGAALPVFVNEFFLSLGISVQEAYGLTETSPVITLNGADPGTVKVGSVGRPLPSYEVRVADDGELLVRGPSVFKGYWGKPERTAEVIDDEGFFHTGDVVRIDGDGFVFITDRKKDLLVTAGGKNIAPQPIESRLKESPYVDAAVLVGDGRPYVVALISPAEDGLGVWAREHAMDDLTLAELVARPEVVALFQAAVDAVNADLARFEQIKRFRVLPRPLSVDDGQLTPTLKVKRRVVAAEYGTLIEDMY